MPTAWVTSGRDPGRFENAQADFMASVRALENRVPFIAANKTGVELESVAYCGKSVVFDAAGNTLARGGERDETIVRADVEIGTAPARPNTTFAATLTQAAPSGGRARVAFTLANAADEVARLAVLAHQADADVLLARGAPLTAGTQAAAVLASAQGEPGTLLDVAGVRIAIAGDAVFRSPHGLVE